MPPGGSRQNRFDGSRNHRGGRRRQPAPEPGAARRDRGGEPVREIARSYNVSRNTISRLAA